MAIKESGDVLKTETSLVLSTVEEMGGLVDEAFRRPYYLFGHLFWPGGREVELEDDQLFSDTLEEGNNVERERCRNNAGETAQY